VIILEKLNYCNDGRCKQTRMGEKHSHDKPAIVNSNDENFNKMIIDQTNLRIQEELSNLSADELKASVIVGVVPAIFGLLAAVASTIFAKIFQNFTIYNMAIFLPFGLLIISFFLALKVIFPRTRFDLWEPRDSNNEYSALKIEDATKKLKEERIEDFESIRDSRDKDATNLKYGYVLLIFGSLSLLVITTLLSSGT